MENIVFKQSLMGFDRAQVLSYIDELASQLKAQETEYTNTQQRLQSEIASLSDNLTQNGKIVDEAKEKIDLLSKDLEYFKQNNIELKRQINTYRNLILEKDRELSQVKINYNSLADQRDILEKENLQWQSKQNEIAVCMVEANVRAREIVENANQQAQQAKQQFEANAGLLFDKVQDVKVEIATVEAQLEESFKKLQNAMSAMDSSAKTIEEQVNEYKKQTDSLDKGIMASIDTQKETPNAPKAQRPQIVLKKTLTDSVLDTISKLLER